MKIMWCDRPPEICQAAVGRESVYWWPWQSLLAERPSGGTHALIQVASEKMKEIEEALPDRIWRWNHQQFHEYHPEMMICIDLSDRLSGIGGHWINICGLAVQALMEVLQLFSPKIPVPGNGSMFQTIFNTPCLGSIWVNLDPLFCWGHMRSNFCPRLIH